MRLLASGCDYCAMARAMSSFDSLMRLYALKIAN